MQKYIGVKLVKAEPKKLGTFNHLAYRDMKGDPEADGYMVKYDTGYESWCPKQQFEEANRRCDAMTFGHAIEAMKKGLKVARAGWNGKGIFVCIILPGNAAHLGYPMQACIAMKTADNLMQPGWLASQTDMLAEDWAIIE